MKPLTDLFEKTVIKDIFISKRVLENGVASAVISLMMELWELVENFSHLIYHLENAQ